MNRKQVQINGKETVLLLLLPFWMPLIPPLGIACLKSFLLQHGYHVKTADGNTDPCLRELYDFYFDTLKRCIPEGKRGNFYSIGQDVLRNHLMAHLNYNNEDQYLELVMDIIFKTFYTDVDREVIRQLNREINKFYKRLETYLRDLLEEVNPDVLGLSLFNGTLPTSYFAMKFAKERYPHLRVVLGGGAFADQLAIGTFNMDFFLEKVNPYVDKILIGEGEILFLRYLRGELPGNQKVCTLNDIDWEIMDIHSARIADLSDFNVGAYPNLASYTSRSCPFQCSFCSETVQWGKYRKKSGEQIVRELVTLYRKYGKQLVFMSDSLLNPVLDDLARAFLKSDVSIYWDGCIRADKHVCDTRNTMLWRRGGFYRARLGLESGSQRVLNLMGKRITVEQMSNALTSLAYAGIKTSTLWLIGHPGETEEDFQKTLDFIEEFRDFMYDAEGTPFWYHLRGQSNSDEWYKRKSVSLYPPEAKELLIAQTWVLEGEPSRAATYERLNRFTRHIDKLGIPNPYSLRDIYQADERWQKLHKNTVPPLIKLENPDIYIDENKKIRDVGRVQNSLRHDEDWGF